MADFTQKVFNLFDGDGDAFLTFEEFTLAVEVKDTTGNPLGKLAWLFDTVYDKVSKTLTEGIFETGAYGVPSRSQNPTVLDQGGPSSTLCSNSSLAFVWH